MEESINGREGKGKGRGRPRKTFIGEMIETTGCNECPLFTYYEESCIQERRI